MTNDVYPKIIIEIPNYSITFDFKTMYFIAIENGKVIGNKQFTLESFNTEMNRVIQSLKDKGY